MMEMLVELETKSEERFHEGEQKRLNMFLDTEERRRKDQAEEERMYRREEQQYEERLQDMDDMHSQMLDHIRHHLSTSTLSLPPSTS